MYNIDVIIMVIIKYTIPLYILTFNRERVITINIIFLKLAYICFHKCIYLYHLKYIIIIYTFTKDNYNL